MSKSATPIDCLATRSIGIPGTGMTPAPGLSSALDSGPSAPVPTPNSTDITRSLLRVSRVEQRGGQLAVAIEPATLCNLFGVSGPCVATRLLSQVIGVIQPDPHEPVDAATVDQALSLIEGVSPTDTLEAMTATMLVAAQHAALDSLRRASHPDQTPAGRQSYTGLSLKAIRTFAQLLEVLDRGRGKGVTQQIIVKRVSVESGGQAVVASVKVDGGGGHAKSTRQSHGSGSGYRHRGRALEETGR